jgi:hypothetical protein
MTDNTFRDRLACQICDASCDWAACEGKTDRQYSCDYEPVHKSADRALAFFSSVTLEAWKRSQGHSRAYEVHNLPRWLREAWGVEKTEVVPTPFNINGNDHNRETRTF